MLLVTTPAAAEPPPDAAPQAPVPPTAPLSLPGAPPSLPGPGGLGPAGAGDQLPGGPLVEKPSLAKMLPIASYVLTPIAAAGGALVYVLLGGNAINDLKDPSKHTTPDQTHDLVVRARVGQAVSGALFGFTGAFTAWGTISTVRTVMKLSKLAKLPAMGASVVPLPGGMVVGVQGGF